MQLRAGALLQKFDCHRILILLFLGSLHGGNTLEESIEGLEICAIWQGKDCYSSETQTDEYGEFTPNGEFMFWIAVFSN